MQTKYSVCPHDCPDTCALRVEIDEGSGEIVKVVGDPDHPVTKGIICEKVRAYPERIYGSSRILYPMKRKGEKGSGEFKRISWEEAVRTITEKWKELIGKHGPESIMPYSYGGTEGIINNKVMDRRLFNKIGATRLNRTICSAAGNTGYQLAYGKSIGINPLYSADSKLIIFWGINALETNMHQTVIAGNARKNGARIIAIDVHKNKTAKWADDFYMILPGSDGALAFGIAHIIIRDNLADEEFLRNYTDAFSGINILQEDGFAHGFLSKVSEYPPERVAELTGISKERLENLAHDFAHAKPSFIRIGNGLQHHKNGGINAWAISLLPALTGAWKYKGGGAIRSNSGYFPFNMNALERPDLLHASPRIVNMVQLGKTLCELDPPIRSIYIYNSNPAVIAPNQNLVLKGLAREDLFTVVHEQTMTDTVKWADIILPATTAFEHADLYASYWQTSLQWADPVIPRIGEAKPNIDVFKMLAQALEFTELCFFDSEEDIARQALSITYWKERGVTFDRLKKERFIMLDVPDLPFAAGSFFTPSGKIEFNGYNRCISDSNSNSVLVGCKFKNKSLRLITPPNHFYLNSSFANVPSLKLKACEPLIEINPEDAAERGIKDGDTVKVENSFGSVVLKAKVIDSVLPGVAVSAGLWWRENYKNGCGLNSLTPDDLSDIGGGATFFSALVDITSESCSKE